MVYASVSRFLWFPPQNHGEGFHSASPLALLAGPTREGEHWLFDRLAVAACEAGDGRLPGAEPFFGSATWDFSCFSWVALCAPQNEAVISVASKFGPGFREIPLRK